jgi:hypothetical protein
MSGFFPQVVKQVGSSSVEIRKLVRPIYTVPQISIAHYPNAGVYLPFTIVRHVELDSEVSRLMRLN